MEQCTHCGAWGNDEICPYCDCEMPNVKRKRAEKEKAAAEAAASRARAESEAPEPAAATFVPFSKRRTITLVLCIFGGFFGLHYFYNGRIARGLVYLFTFGIFYVGWIADIFIILLGRFKDRYGEYVL